MAAYVEPGLYFKYLSSSFYVIFFVILLRLDENRSNLNFRVDLRLGLWYNCEY